jgi:hypothetical protein
MTAWKNDVYPVLLCPEPSLIEAVRSAARDFCNETHLWILALDRISVVANTQAYALAMPTAWLTLAEIVIVDNVKYKQTGDTDDQFVTLDPVSENQKDLHDSGNWKFRTATIPNGYWVDLSEKKLYFYYIPTVASTTGLLVTAVLKPTLIATVVPEFLYDDYRDCITFGALAHLFNQRQARWFDPTLAEYYNAKFEAAYSDSKWRKITGATKRRARLNLNLKKGIWP